MGTASFCGWRWSADRRERGSIDKHREGGRIQGGNNDIPPPSKPSWNLGICKKYTKPIAATQIKIEIRMGQRVMMKVKRISLGEADD